MIHRIIINNYSIPTNYCVEINLKLLKKFGY